MMENSGFKGYRKLIVWQKSQELAHQVYGLTKVFPKEEFFGITTQLRRAVVSVPTNIAEGMGRQGRNETRQFLNISLGSLAETSSLLDLSTRLGYVDADALRLIEGLRDEVGAMLWSLYKKY